MMEELESKIQIAVTMLYQENKEGYKIVIDILNDIINNNITNKENIKNYIKIILKAMEEDDATKMADILLFEICPRIVYCERKYI